MKPQPRVMALSLLGSLTHRHVDGPPRHQEAQDRSRPVLDNLGEQMVFLKTEEGYLPQAVEVGTRQGGYVEIVRVLAYVRMPKDIYPDLNAPLVNIITENPGMAAEDVERLITLPLESLLSGAPGVTRIRSESTTGDSVVTVEFDWGMDIYRARQIVSSKLEQVAGRLPQNSTAPILGPVSSRMGEVFEFAVVGDETTDPMELRSVADWTIRYRLQGVPGVSFIVNLRDQSALILKSLDHLQVSILQGALLIVLVMLLFLWDVRSALRTSTGCCRSGEGRDRLWSSWRRRRGRWGGFSSLRASSSSWSSCPSSASPGSRGRCSGRPPSRPRPPSSGRSC